MKRENVETYLAANAITRDERGRFAPGEVGQFHTDDPNFVSQKELLAYENREQTPEETKAMFQKLHNSGMAYDKLDPHYARTAKKLLKEGIIKDKPLKEKAKDAMKETVGDIKAVLSHPGHLVYDVGVTSVAYDAALAAATAAAGYLGIEKLMHKKDEQVASAHEMPVSAVEAYLLAANGAPPGNKNAAGPHDGEHGVVAGVKKEVAKIGSEGADLMNKVMGKETHMQAAHKASAQAAEAEKNIEQQETKSEVANAQLDAAKAHLAAAKAHDKVGNETETQLHVNKVKDLVGKVEQAAKTLPKHERLLEHLTEFSADAAVGGLALFEVAKLAKKQEQG